MVIEVQGEGIPTPEDYDRALADYLVPAFGANYGIDTSSPSPVIESSAMTATALRSLSDRIAERAGEMYDEVTRNENV